MPAAPRRSQALPDDVANKMDGLAGLLKRQLNNVLTALLLVAAVFLLVRWRMRAADVEKQTIAGKLGNAIESLQQLETGSYAVERFAENDPRNYDGKAHFYPPAQAIKAAEALEADVEKYLSDVLNSSSIDEQTKLRALQVRGDLYWTLANFPLEPGSGDKLAETPDVLLAKAADAYTEVAGADHTKYPEPVDGAKLSLAAVAVNKGDLAGAQRDYQEVADDTLAPGFLRDAAKARIAALPALKTSTALVATTTAPSDDQTISPTTNPTSMPGTATPGMYGPPVPPGMQVPAAMQVPGSTSMPTSVPVIPTPTSVPSAVPMVPATTPAK